MVMSVSERTREIGVKKAVGAEDLDILAEYLVEAVAISLMGGLIGLTLGCGMAAMLNRTIASALEDEIGALAFALILGIAGGLYPAWRAARLDPVQALRAE
ncbi:MAG: FtsX-like permease family protein [Anaerolineae bacterium]|nr:FtsX-like permease family protein [Anaerolineae bacterium]